MTMDNKQLREIHRAPRLLTVRILKSRRLSPAGTVDGTVERGNICGILTSKPFGIRLLVRRRKRHEDNIKLDL
jgi:hypothetical protein